MISWQIHSLGSQTQGKRLLSEENQTGRRPDIMELKSIICWTQQNELNEQEHWKPLWLTEHRVQKANSSYFLKLWGRGDMQSPELMRCLVSCTGRGWRMSFPRLPLVHIWSRNLPSDTAPWTLSCSDSMDQTQQVDLAKGTLQCGCLK